MRLRGRTGREEVKDLDRVMDRSRRISRESAELAYIWDSEGVRKMEIVVIGNSVEYI